MALLDIFKPKARPKTDDQKAVDEHLRKKAKEAHDQKNIAQVRLTKIEVDMRKKGQQDQEYYDKTITEIRNIARSLSTAAGRRYP